MKRKIIPFLKLMGPDGKQSDHPITLGAEFMYPSSPELYDFANEFLERVCKNESVHARLNKGAYIRLVEMFGVEEDGSRPGKVNPEEQEWFLCYSLRKIMKHPLARIGTEENPYEISVEEVLSSNLSYEGYIHWKYVEAGIGLPTEGLESFTLGLL